MKMKCRFLFKSAKRRKCMNAEEIRGEAGVIYSPFLVHLEAQERVFQGPLGQSLLTQEHLLASLRIYPLISENGTNKR
jgi:hypothetical protein